MKCDNPDNPDNNPDNKCDNPDNKYNYVESINVVKQATFFSILIPHKLTNNLEQKIIIVPWKQNYGLFDKITSSCDCTFQMRSYLELV